MKHLNPRQGITINPPPLLRASAGVKHLNPRQGITIYRVNAFQLPSTSSVKHLNPRQGITIEIKSSLVCSYGNTVCVKHLNPRQGITIQFLFVPSTRH